MSVDREKLAEIIEAALLSQHDGANWARATGGGTVRMDGDFDMQTIADMILAGLAGFPPDELPFIVGRYRGDFFGATIDGDGPQRFTLSNGSVVTLTPPESNEF